MDAIFNFTPRSTTSIREMLSDLVSQEDFVSYLVHHNDVELTIKLSPRAKSSEKQQMYAYYHGPLLSVAVRMFTDLGYELMDKVKADYLLKSECAVGTMIRNGKEEIYLEDKAVMSKDRLLKYIQDCIFFLESNGYETPDSDEYKNQKKYGRKFTTVRVNKRSEEF